MFNQTNDNETDFCESYKSEILGNDEPKEGESLFSTMVKLLTILILLASILGLSFYGYNYFKNNHKTNNTDLPPVSIEKFDEDLVVKIEDKEAVTDNREIEVKKSESTKENISMPTIITSQTDESKIDEVANSVKIAIAKSEEEAEKKTKVEEKVEEKSLEVPSSVPEAEYLEELARLSKEIDKDRK